MNLDKVALDKFLTTEPYDQFDYWAEQTINQVSEPFYEANEKWLTNFDGVCDRWLTELWDRDKNTQEAAAIIQRAFTLYRQA